MDRDNTFLNQDWFESNAFSTRRSGKYVENLLTSILIHWRIFWSLQGDPWQRLRRSSDLKNSAFSTIDRVFQNDNDSLVCTVKTRILNPYSKMYVKKEKHLRVMFLQQGTCDKTFSDW